MIKLIPINKEEFKKLYPSLECQYCHFELDENNNCINCEECGANDTYLLKH